jgi:hypothetical protein
MTTSEEIIKLYETKHNKQNFFTIKEKVSKRKVTKQYCTQAIVTFQRFF